MLRDVEREARLADRRAGGEDHEVALLEPGGQRVEVAEPRPDAADLAAVRVQVVEPVVRVVEQATEEREARRDPPLADREQLGLRAIDGLLDLGRVLVADAGDPARGPDQVPQHGLALDDARVLGRVDRGRGGVRERAQVRAPADRLEVLGALQGLGDGDDVDGLAPLEQVEDDRVDLGVGLPVEVLGLEELGDLDDRVAVDEDRAEDGLLGFDGLRGQAIDHSARRMRSRRVSLSGTGRPVGAKVPAWSPG